MKNSRWWTVWAWNSMIFFAGANFIALRRSACSYTWLVERYASRVMQALGDFCERMPVMESIFFGHISPDFSNRAQSHCDPVFFPTRICSGGAIDRWDRAFEFVAKAWWWHSVFYETFIFKITWNIAAGGPFGYEIQWIFVSLARISLLCGVALAHIHDS